MVLPLNAFQFPYMAIFKLIKTSFASSAAFEKIEKLCTDYTLIYI